VEQKKILRRIGAVYTIVMLLAAIIALTGATYAWFTFNASTDVRPMTGTVTGGDGDLTISSSPNGPFDVSCDLAVIMGGSLEPISTDDLNDFYVSTLQNVEGTAVLYSPVDDLEPYTIRGTLYLRSDHAGCDLYFWPAGLDFGSDDQALAALRLGLRITSSNGTVTHIFTLDDMGNTADAESRQTIQTAGTVVASADAAGHATLVPDPAVPISGFFATGTETAPEAGGSALCTLPAGEVVTVEFWLYLEGCDDNCFNPVQDRDMALQLSFAGV